MNDANFVIIDRHERDKETNAIGPFDSRGDALNWIDNRFFVIKDNTKVEFDNHWEDSIFMDHGCICAALRLCRTDEDGNVGSSRIAFFMIMPIREELP